MVLCVVIGCSKRSGRDKDVSYYRIPVVIRHQSEREYELSKKRRDGFLAAISRYLTEHCGIVLADRGFDIADSVGTVHARLHIPAFTKGKNQLTASEVEETRTIANVRIHVERVIGNVRQKFPILQSTLPIHFIVKRVGEDFPLIDRIVRICCALNNVCDSVVPFD